MLSYCAAGSTDMGPPLFEVLVANSVLVCVPLEGPVLALFVANLLKLI